MVEGSVASWLVCSSLDQLVQVWALAGDIVLCSWARHFTLTVPPSTQMYELVSVNSVLGVTLRWTCIPFRGSRNTPSHSMLHKPGYKLWPDRPLGLYPDTKCELWLINGFQWQPSTNHSSHWLHNPSQSSNSQKLTFNLPKCWPLAISSKWVVRFWCSWEWINNVWSQIMPIPPQRGLSDFLSPWGI